MLAASHILDRPGSTEKSFGLVDEPTQSVRWLFWSLFDMETTLLTNGEKFSERDDG